MLGHKAEVQADLGMKIKAFSDSVVQLVHARTIKKSHNGYEMRIWIMKDVLETAVGPQEAIGAIAVQVAREIQAKHTLCQQIENHKPHPKNGQANIPANR